MGDAVHPQGIKTMREVPLLLALLMLVMVPLCLVLWIITAPILILNTVAAVPLSAASQRDWFALMRSLPPKGESDG